MITISLLIHLNKYVIINITHVSMIFNATILLSYLPNKKFQRNPVRNEYSWKPPHISKRWCENIIYAILLIITLNLSPWQLPPAVYLPTYVYLFSYPFTFNCFHADVNNAVSMKVSEPSNKICFRYCCRKMEKDGRRNCNVYSNSISEIYIYIYVFVYDDISGW